MDDCDDGRLFSRARTTSGEDGGYALGLEGITGWSGGVGSELGVVCAELIAEEEARVDTVRIDGISVRFLLADTIGVEFELR